MYLIHRITEINWSIVHDEFPLQISINCNFKQTLILPSQISFIKICDQFGTD